VVQEHYRSRGPRLRSGRQRPREVRLAEANAVGGPPGSASLAALLDEFAATLTPRERLFLREHLLGGPGATSGFCVSPVYRRKLRQRVGDKLLAFLYED
jgi:hypothetical protein